MNKINEFILKNKIFLLIYLVSLSFFIIQHYWNLSWDFQVYLLNGDFWFNNGFYFEPSRPPVLPFTLGLFSLIFNSVIVQYLYIVLITTFFAFTTYILAKSLKLNPILFYIISLNPFLLFYGLFDGTELLTIAFTELAIYFIVKKSYWSGLFVALAGLSRYTAILFFPIIFLHLKMKTIIKSFLLYALPFAIWFIYNFSKWGNFFYSISDQYALNVLFRSYTIQPIVFNHFAIVLNILLPFVIVGVIIKLVAFFKDINYTKEILQSIWKTIKKRRIELIFLFLLIYSIRIYVTVPFKIPRYLFYILLPGFYYAYFGFKITYDKVILRLKIKLINKKIIVSVLLLILIFFSFYSGLTEIRKVKSPTSITQIEFDLAELNMNDCLILSNDWPNLIYHGIDSKMFPREELFDRRIEEGYKVLFFIPSSEPKYANKPEFLEKPIILERDGYILFGNNNECVTLDKYEGSYLGRLHDEILELHNEEININPCLILFHSHSLFEKTCNLINLNGFKIDENRNLGV